MHVGIPERNGGQHAEIELPFKQWLLPTSETVAAAAVAACLSHL
jgi:hypothetical protein